MSTSLTAWGRWLFVLSFSFYVFLHFGLPDVGVNTYVPKYLPFPYFWNYLTGAGLLAFIVSASLGRFDKLAALLLSVYLLLVAVLIHAPHAADPMELLNVFRIANMIGGALMYAGAVARDQRLWFGSPALA
ncbi:hypothetical protein [Hymenobacter terrenus]|uniref:hypothetical protein n=1 Tax=Hymenobacter terrenus TaxID=1629124 RepID=UPI0006193222|nr:hypothetical protein [Hymenobacter terrenus]